MECFRCGNQDQRYFYLGSKGYYCRKCVNYQRFLINEPAPYYLPYQSENDSDYYLTFQLTKLQEAAINQIATIVKTSNLVVYAACGAGKTEMMFPIIKSYLINNKRVGFAIARRQVVLELFKRFKKAFPNLKIVKVCQGYTKDTFGDLIICTTHQLFRYYQYFDLLIIDEPDAFPFKGDDILHNISKSSCKERIIYLTATPEGELLKLPQVKLFQRPHQHPLPFPKVLVAPKTILLYRLSRFLKVSQKALIFLPTINLVKFYSKLFAWPGLHSRSSQKETIIDEFSKRNNGFLFCTSILERGVTFPKIDVCVLYADHFVFDLAALIQIAGRVGRDPNYPGGQVLFLARKKTIKVDQCLKQINLMNA